MADVADRQDQLDRLWQRGRELAYQSWPVFRICSESLRPRSEGGGWSYPAIYMPATRFFGPDQAGGDVVIKLGLVDMDASEHLEGVSNRSMHTQWLNPTEALTSCNGTITVYPPGVPMCPLGHIRRF